MNVFLYGMQSSGASLLTFFIGQLPRSVVLVDVWNDTVVPSLDEAKSTADHVIAKCVITTAYSLEDHVASFQPDLKLLVLRHPIHNYISLMRKPYEAGGGDIDDKFRKLEHLFCTRDCFDGVLVYEDFVLRPDPVIRTLNTLGLAVNKSAFQFSRSREDIIQFNIEQSAWCRDHWDNGWGFGNIKKGVSSKYLFKYTSPAVASKVYGLCPQVYTYMDQHYADHVSNLTRWRGSLWHDGVIRKAKGLKKSLHHG